MANLLTLSVYALEGYSSHFVLSVCLSMADLEDGELLVLQRDTNLKSTRFESLYFATFFWKFGIVLGKSEKTLCRSSAP